MDDYSAIVIIVVSMLMVFYFISFVSVVRDYQFCNALSVQRNLAVATVASWCRTRFAYLAALSETALDMTVDKAFNLSPNSCQC